MTGVSDKKNKLAKYDLYLMIKKLDPKTIAYLIREAADYLRLSSDLENRQLSSIRLSGKLKGLPLHSEIMYVESKLCLHSSISYTLPDTGSWSITAESGLSLLAQQVGIKDIQVGIQVFDNAFLLKAKNEGHLLSFLSYRVRQMIFDLNKVAHKWVIKDTGLTFSIPLDKLQDKSQLVSILQGAASIPLNMAVHSGYQKRLIDIVLQGKDAAFRMKCLDLLNKQFSEQAETITTNKQVFQDIDINMRIFAAPYLGKQGMRFLLGLLQKKNNQRVILNAIQSLEKCADEKSIPALTELDKRNTDPEIRKSIQHALAVIKDRSGLVQGWLSISESPEVEGGLSMPDNEEGGLSMEEYE